MLAQLKQLVSHDQIRPIDYQFARFIYSLHQDNLLALTSALVSYQLGQGHVCLALGVISENELFGQNSEVSQQLIATTGVSIKHWAEHLRSLPTVGSGREVTPLVLDNHRLYLYRYWDYEQHVAGFLKEKQSIDVDTHTTSLILNRLFRRNYAFLWDQCKITDTEHAAQAMLIKWLDIEEPDPLPWPQIHQCLHQAKKPDDLKPLNKLIPQSHCLNWQKIAVTLAASQSFSIISGGPGTGKTTTVIRLLALLIELGINDNNCPNIQLIAPTGKAAARLTESISGAKDKLDCSDNVKAEIPVKATTLHRLLGVIPKSNNFRHNKNNRLHLDILVVDEASMIDLPMMSRLVEALPNHARLILLGDRDQLASVEAGSVLGDICAAAHGGYSQKNIQLIEEVTGFNLSHYAMAKAKAINNSLCLLQKSYRFDDSSGIANLANAVNTGNRKAIERTLKKGFTDIALHGSDEKEYQAMINLCSKGYQHYISLINKGACDRDILNAFNRFQLLCALREGPFGVTGLNESIRKALIASNTIKGDQIWYEGKPVLITRNDHELNLYNGDIGITLTANDGRFSVVFEMPDGTLKRLLPSRLPEHETVFAMTIHKSQGSEFEHTVIALPDSFNPIITRELLYTGITRAKKKLDIFCEKTLLLSTINTPTQRTSGLKERLQ
ncbi:MAG: exodeoxyribonuclease V subunit alpha [Endozoicomonas sp. (ex Botrylloides leachii)]|nr:exodeoxyribonuclease V subunit alpha [Endozoicomonas sp. (ex Botrylloides leachii)]